MVRALDLADFPEFYPFSPGNLYDHYGWQNGTLLDDLVDAWRTARRMPERKPNGERPCWPRGDCYIVGAAALNAAVRRFVLPKLGVTCPLHPLSADDGTLRSGSS
jgi:hypothetical protein